MGVLIDFLYEVVKVGNGEVGEGQQCRIKNRCWAPEDVAVICVKPSLFNQSTAAARLPVHKCVFVKCRL